MFWQQQSRANKGESWAKRAEERAAPVALPTLLPADWDWRLNSTFPDAVPRAVTKTMLIALGCAHPLEPAPPAHLACPVVCFDDCPNVSSAPWLLHLVPRMTCMCLLWPYALRGGPMNLHVSFS